jgi:hypothetical protein
VTAGRVGGQLRRLVNSAGRGGHGEGLRRSRGEAAGVQLGAYLERLADRAAKLPVGDPHTDQVALGPLSSERQLANVDRIVTSTLAAGVELRAGGTRDRLFYTPACWVR